MLKVIGGVSYIASAVHGWSIKLKNIDEVKLVKRSLGLPSTCIQIEYGRKVIYVGGEDWGKSVEHYEKECGKKFESEHEFLDTELYNWLFINFCTGSTLF